MAKGSMKKSGSFAGKAKKTSAGSKAPQYSAKNLAGIGYAKANKRRKQC